MSGGEPESNRPAEGKRVSRGWWGRWTCCGLALLLACGAPAAQDPAAKEPVGSSVSAETDRRPIERFDVEIVRTLPHDPRSYTQGLILVDGLLIESHGLYGRSGLMRYRPGERAQERVRLAADLFGEGVERSGDRVFQLTWRAGKVLVYDLSTLELLEERRLEGEGWGIASDGQRLWISDGTHRLRAYDPVTFERVGSTSVTREGVPQSQLNELEWADGSLWANVYQTDEIVRIDVESGLVTGVVDASELLEPRLRAEADVLNGIAYDRSSGTFFVTGKLWPKLFEVRFVESSAD